MNLLQRTAKKFVLIKATHRLKEEMEKAGIENLKAIAETGQSIFGIYLKGCSPEEREGIKSDLNSLLQMEITPDMLLEELTLQMPELKPIMDGKEKYRRSEIAQIMAFLKGR